MSPLFTHAEDVVLANDEMFLALDADLGSRVLAEEHAVALLDVERQDGSIFLDLPLANGDDLGFLGGEGEGEDAPMADFSLTDINPTSSTYDQSVSPRQYQGEISGWYFAGAL